LAHFARRVDRPSAGNRLVEPGRLVTCGPISSSAAAIARVCGRVDETWQVVAGLRGGEPPGRLARRRGGFAGSRAAPSPTGPARESWPATRLEAGPRWLGVDVQLITAELEVCPDPLRAVGDHVLEPHQACRTARRRRGSVFVIQRLGQRGPGREPVASHLTSSTTRPRCSAAPAGRIGATGKRNGVRRGSGSSSSSAMRVVAPLADRHRLHPAEDLHRLAGRDEPRGAVQLARLHLPAAAPARAPPSWTSPVRTSAATSSLRRAGRDTTSCTERSTSKPLPGPATARPRGSNEPAQGKEVGECAALE